MVPISGLTTILSKLSKTNWNRNLNYYSFCKPNGPLRILFAYIYKWRIITNLNTLVKGHLDKFFKEERNMAARCGCVVRKLFYSTLNLTYILQFVSHSMFKIISIIYCF